MYLVLAGLMGLHAACGDNATTNVPVADSLAKADSAKTIISPKDTLAEKFAWKAPVYDSAKKYIYLTFDDGPQAGTMICYDICKELGIKSTFFMVGDHASDTWGKQIVATIRNSYPYALLTNHSYYHAKNRYEYFYKHPVTAFEDFMRAQQSLQVPYKIIRLPGNSAWVRKNENKSSSLVKPVCKLLDSAGYNVIGWDVEWNFRYDGTSRPVQTAETMINMVKYALGNNNTHTKNHVVILTHDRMFREKQYADSLRKFIRGLQQNFNYVFETIDHYPGIKQPQF